MSPAGISAEAEPPPVFPAPPSAETLFIAGITVAAASPRVQQLALATAALITEGSVPLLPPLLAAAKCLLMPTPPEHVEGGGGAPVGGKGGVSDLGGGALEGQVANTAAATDHAAATPSFPAPGTAFSPAACPAPCSAPGFAPTAPPRTDPNSDLYDACAYSALLLLRFSPALSRLSAPLPHSPLDTAPRLAAAAAAAERLGWATGSEASQGKAVRPHLRAPALPAGWAAEPVRARGKS